MQVLRSDYDHDDTLERLGAALDRRGLKLFARIDHTDAAREVGMELAAEDVMLFGNPAAGTPLMQANPQVGIELPLRILVWDDAAGTHLGYHDPRELVDRYRLADHATMLEAMAALLGALVAEAAGGS